MRIAFDSTNSSSDSSLGVASLSLSFGCITCIAIGGFSNTGGISTRLQGGRRIRVLGVNA